MFFVFQHQSHSNIQDSWLWHCSQHLWSRALQTIAKLRDLSQLGKVGCWAHFLHPENSGRGLGGGQREGELKLQQQKGMKETNYLRFNDT